MKLRHDRTARTTTPRLGEETDIRPGAAEADAEAREADRIEAREAREHRPAVVTGPRPDNRLALTHERYGGIDFPASFVGTLTALALVVLLGGLAGAIFGAVGYQTGLDGTDIAEITIGGLIGGLVVLFLAYAIGGWAAGRIARYDGLRNGLMTGVWTILLAAIASGLAAWGIAEYDVLRDVNLPQWFSRDALTTGAIISGLVAAATMLIAGALGGAWGARYHRRADEMIAGAGDPRIT